MLISYSKQGFLLEIHDQHLTTLIQQEKNNLIKEYLINKTPSEINISEIVNYRFLLKENYVEVYDNDYTVICELNDMDLLNNINNSIFEIISIQNTRGWGILIKEILVWVGRVTAEGIVCEQVIKPVITYVWEGSGEPTGPAPTDFPSHGGGGFGGGNEYNPGNGINIGPADMYPSGPKSI
ncbi:MAG: hypothetical protein M0Q02_03225 [Candidatus Muirbacterium halophilum]|nr:hypothetical protein [Candidatus Muirbacterium halophilum]